MINLDRFELAHLNWNLKNYISFALVLYYFSSQTDITFDLEHHRPFCWLHRDRH